MPFELFAEEWEEGVGIAVEDSFGVFKNPTVWIPAKVELEPKVGYREVDLPINEIERTHVSIGPQTCDGKITIQVCPGQEAILFGAAGILSFRDRIRPRSFSVVKCMGQESQRFRGVTVDQYTVKAAKDEDLVLDLDTKGVGMEIGPAWTPDYSGLLSPYILQELDLLVAGQERINFDSIEISATRELRDDIYGNSLLRQDMTAKKVTGTVKLEGFRDGNNLLREAHYSGALVGLEAQWTRTKWVKAAAPQCLVWDCNPDNVREPVELRVLKTAGSEVSGMAWTYG